MTGIPRRPPLVGLSRSSTRPPTLNTFDHPTVINATALPRSMSYNTTTNLTSTTSSATIPATTNTTSTVSTNATTIIAASSSAAATVSNSGSASNLQALHLDRDADIPPSPDNKLFKAATESGSLPLVRDSLARDPFVSISRAIHNAKLRAAASLRTTSIPPTPVNKYHTRLARYRALCMTIRRVWRPITFLTLILTLLYILQSIPTPWPFSLSSHSTRNTSQYPVDLRSASSSLRMLQRHMPRAYRSRRLTSGPWLIGLVADLDRESCRRREGTNGKLHPTACTAANVWVSYLKRGILTLTPGSSSSRRTNNTGGTASSLSVGRSGGSVVSVEWVDEIELEEGRPPAGGRERGNRGMELSELEWFHGRLLAPDDRTGAIVEIISPYGDLPSHAAKLLPAGSSRIPPGVRRRGMMLDGSGDDAHLPFKGEWMVVKDDTLMIGGHGRPYTAAEDGARVVSVGPKWVKVVDEGLRVSHANWSEAYDLVASAVGVRWPGYVMHEAVLFSHDRREWIFLPRRRSKEAFDAERNQLMGWNVAVIGNEDLSHLRLLTIDGLRDSSGTRGFSSAKFVPGSGDRLVVALRTVEVETQSGTTWNRKTASYLSVFDIESGAMVMEETLVSDRKYEGFVFM